MLDKQELHCHNCNKYVQFDVDIELNGNHVLECPSCGHEHCRVVKDGVITADRWDSRNPTYSVPTNNISFTTNSTFSTYSNYNSTSNSTPMTTVGQNSNTGVSYFLYQSWSNSGQYGTNGTSNSVYIP